MTSLARITELRKAFGGVNAVAGVSLDIPTGSVVGLIGPNGSGKSTLMNLLSGQLDADGGSIEMFGRDVTRLRPERRAALGLARMFQQPRVVLTLTPLENIALGTWAATRGWASSISARRWRRSCEGAAAAAEEFEITDLLDRQTEQLSHVERRMIEMARIVAADARLLLLDEPMAGLDRDEKDLVVDRIRALHRADRTIVVVEHDVAVIRTLCDQVHCLARGELICTGTPDEVVDDPQVRQLYLGRSRTADRARQLETNGDTRR
jgi:branched-chain amino acid transport system permease protein